MLNRKNKKGFTLAELLIVVAIIAVLVAIAVPLFVGALKDAEENVKKANIRAVRGAAVEEILLDGKDGEAKKDYSMTGPWYATATVTANGDVKDLKIYDTTCPSAFNSEAETLTKNGGVCKDGEDGGYSVCVYITKLDGTKGS